MDELDRAKELEMADRESALNRQLEQAKETETPLERDGVRVCLDCGDPIDPKRLAARPEAVRCVWCKYIKERR